MEFYVETLKGMQIGRFDMPGDTFLLDVKRQIARETGIPVEGQRLIYFQKELQNQRTLDEYGLGFIDKVVLILISTHVP